MLVPPLPPHHSACAPTYFGVMAIGTRRCHSPLMSTGELLGMAYLCIMLITSGIGRGKRYTSAHERKPTLSPR